MGERPVGCSIDRLDNEKGYYKENCRWATQLEQQNNRSDNVIMELNGDRLTMSQWAVKLGIPVHRLAHRKKRGWSDERSLVTPKHIVIPKPKRIKKPRLKHGMWGTSAYQRWFRIRRSGSICQEWLDIKKFMEDVGPAPEGKQLVRIDLNLPYSASNFRWSESAKDQKGRKNTVLIEHGGQVKSIAQWAREIGIGAGLLHHRLKTGWTVEEALNTPKGRQGPKLNSTHGGVFEGDERVE